MSEQMNADEIATAILGLLDQARAGGFIHLAGGPGGRHRGRHDRRRDDRRMRPRRMAPTPWGVGAFPI